MNEYKKEKNRFLVTLIMVLALTLLIFRGTALAAAVYTEDDFYYEVQGEAIVITGYFGTDTEITLPDRIAGYPVSKIAQGAFKDTDTVKTINLPDTIMEIEEEAIAQGMKVVYMSNADTSRQSEPDSPDSAEPEEAGKDDGMKTDKEMNGEDNKETASEETIGNDATVAEKEKTGNVEEVEINLPDTVEEENNEDNNKENNKDNNKDNNKENNKDNNKDNNKGIKTGDVEYTIRVDENHHLIIEDSDGNKQVIDEKNEYTMTTDQDGTVTIQNQNGEKVSVDSDGTIKAGENTIVKIEKDGTVKNVRPKNATWLVIIAILVVLGIICVAAVIVNKKKRSGK